MKNSEYAANDIKKICENKLGIVFKTTKESNGWYLLNGVRKNRITVPNGKKFVPRGTYGSMARQLNLSIKDFDRMLGCTLSRVAYDKMMEPPDNSD